MITSEESRVAGISELPQNTSELSTIDNNGQFIPIGQPTSNQLTPQTLQTSAGQSIRALLCGDVDGRLATLANSLSAVNQRQGPFSFALCCGNFFGDSDEFDPNLINMSLQQNQQQPASSTEIIHKLPSERNQISHTTKQFSSNNSSGPESSTNLKDSSYITGYTNFCIPVLFIDSSASPIGEFLRRKHPNGFQLSPSLEFLGGFGFRQICGLSVGFLSGRYDPGVFFDEVEDEESIELPEIPNTSGDTMAEKISQETSEESDEVTTNVFKGKQYFGGFWSTYYCRSVLQKFKELGACYIGKTDLFVSCEWPTGTDETLNPEQKQQLVSLLELGQDTSKDVLDGSHHSGPISVTSPAISELVELFEPRFHLATGYGVFYQRPIFKSSGKGLASRFIGLGRLASAPRVSNDKRLKFFHALILKPISELAEQVLLAVPSASTPSPYFNLYNPRAAPLGPATHMFPVSNINSPGRFKRTRPPPITEYQHSYSLDSTISQFNSEQTRAPFLPPNTSSSFSLSDDTNIYDSKRQRISETSTSPREGASDALTVLQNLLTQQLPVTTVTGSSDMPASPSIPPPPPRISVTEESAMSSPVSNSVFVTNIPYEVDSESFVDVMKSFGPIIGHNFPKSPDGRSVGRAWITYELINSAEQAVAASDQLESGGRLLKIQFTHTQFPARSRRFGDESDNRFNNRNTSGRQQSRRTSQAIDVRPHADCWFCLANPNCEKKLIVSIGEKVYVALAKGGIVHQHVLIIPVTHWPNFVFCPPDVGLELERYINALRRCYKNQGMEAIIYERYFPMKATTGMHMQLQVVPIPSKCAAKSFEVFQSRAERSGVMLAILSPDETISSLRRRITDPVNQSYFYVEMPGSTIDQVERCLCVSRPGDPSQKSLPFNFGRETIAALMDIPHRADWKRCVEPEAIEIQLAQQMQKLFNTFQPK